jgi:hypothetical protein
MLPILVIKQVQPTSEGMAVAMACYTVAQNSIKHLQELILSQFTTTDVFDKHTSMCTTYEEPS